MYYGDFKLKLLVDDYDFIIKKWSEITAETIEIITHIIIYKREKISNELRSKF